MSELFPTASNQTKTSDAIQEPFRTVRRSVPLFSRVVKHAVIRNPLSLSLSLSVCLQMFSVVPRRFLPDVKNPCWFEEVCGDVSADPYRSNLFGRSFRQIQLIFEQLSGSFRRRLTRRDGKLQRLRCLPYFYIIGQPKCGTTDLYERLRLHPDVRLTPPKEPHWWTRKRFGRFVCVSVSVCLSEKLLSSHSHYQLNTQTRTGLKTDTPIMHSSCVCVMFLLRLYSDYLYFGTSNKSALDFHQKVCESLRMFEGCLRGAGLRACVYNSTLNNAMSVRLQVGLYVVFLLDWMSVFSRDQLLVLRLEDHASNLELSMSRTFRFLRLGALSDQRQRQISKRPTSNTRHPSDRDLGPMRPITRELLALFYAPFNQRLAEVLQDESFTWDGRSEHT
uniref:Sulfotransferase n=1 Tax=Sinocyclocheilus grahami TaxID=75366 RepID=A0A672KUW4_SINGR